MMNASLLCLVVLIVATVRAADDDLLESDEMIEEVNNAHTTWKAGRNFHPLLTKDYAKNLLGLKLRVQARPVRVKPEEEDTYNLSAIPESFDAREKWSFCGALQGIRDQASCGSCWAVSSTSAFTDRLCIATNGSFNGYLSAQDLLCVNFGCSGGDFITAWKFFETSGVVTGGDFNSNEGCQPYKIPPCEHKGAIGPRPNCSHYPHYVKTPNCTYECYNKEYKIPYAKDKHMAKKSYNLDSIPQIQTDIMKYGPVVAGFMVCEDFFIYKTGVYQHTTGKCIVGHGVKVIGWGVENNTDYWLASNSWNTDWGDKGFFKIRRGTDECGFDSNMSSVRA